MWNEELDEEIAVWNMESKKSFADAIYLVARHEGSQNDDWQIILASKDKDEVWNTFLDISLKIYVGGVAVWDETGKVILSRWIQESEQQKRKTNADFANKKYSGNRKPN